MPATSKPTAPNMDVVAMPIKTIEVTLDEIGYPGWRVTMRVNPRGSVYDQFMSEDQDQEWEALGKLIISWNLGDEEGKLFPHPGKDLPKGDLPPRIIQFIVSKWFEGFREEVGLPKVLPEDSDTTSTTSESDPKTGNPSPLPVSTSPSSSPTDGPPQVPNTGQTSMQPRGSIG